MRRILMIGITGLAFAVATTARAGPGQDAAMLTFAPSHSGSPGKPSPIAVHVEIAVNGSNPARLFRLTTKIYGLVLDGKGRPVCTGPMMTADPQVGDKACPRGALVAQGQGTELLVGSPTAPGIRCNPRLDVWNGGAGKLWFNFTTSSSSCPGVPPQSGPPILGTDSRVGGYLEIAQPNVPDVVVRSGTTVRTFYASLLRENLGWLKYRPGTGKGKTMASLESIGCHNGKRPYSETFTRQKSSLGPTPGSTTTSVETDSVSHTAKCSK